MGTDFNPLRGRKLLLVEDDYLIAADLAASLAEMGAIIIGPVSSIEEALGLVQLAERIDAGVLDVNLNGTRSYAVADALRNSGVPFVFVTGYDAEMLPAAYRDVPRWDKPLDVVRLTESLLKLIVDRSQCDHDSISEPDGERRAAPSAWDGEIEG